MGIGELVGTSLPGTCGCGCWKPKVGDTASDDSCSKLHPFTLTFQEARTEQEFVRHASEGLRLWLTWFYGVWLAVVCLMLLHSQVWKWEEMNDNDDPYPNSKVEWASKIIVVGAAGLAFHIAVLQCRRLFDRLAFSFMEAYFVGFTIVLLASIPLLNPYFMARMRGYPLACESQDTSVPLLIAGVIMAFHLNPYIRWHKMIALQFASIVAYALPAVLLEATTTERATLNTLFLAGLTACASHGKRMIQTRERLNFANLIAEKATRVATEFKLGQASSDGKRTQPADAASTCESVPTTTATGKVFNITEEAASELDGIRGIGRREKWLVAPQELSLKSQSILGVGAFGVVVKGHYQGIDVAVKVAKAPPQAPRSEPHLVALCNELQILRRLRHPGIVTFYGAWLDERCNDLALVLEFVDGCPLAAFIGNGPSDVDRSHVLVQVSCALRYLHMQQPHIIHGDLKDSNIFILKSGGEGGRKVAKLLDFGLAQRITKSAEAIGGSLRWVAPEVVLRGGRPDTASDVFSFGHVTYFVVTGTLPRGNKSPIALMIDLRKGVPELVWPTGGFSADYQVLVEGCSQLDTTRRPDICEVHESLARIWESKGGGAVKSTDPDPHLQRELWAIRNAARQWKPPDAPYH